MASESSGSSSSVVKELYHTQLNQLKSIADKYRFTRKASERLASQAAPVVLPEQEKCEPPLTNGDGPFGTLVSTYRIQECGVRELAASSTAAYLRRKVVNTLQTESELLATYDRQHIESTERHANRILDWIDDNTLAAIEDFLDIIGVDNATLFHRWISELGTDGLISILELGSKVLDFQECAFSTSSVETLVKSQTAMIGLQLTSMVDNTATYASKMPDLPPTSAFPRFYSDEKHMSDANLSKLDNLLLSLFPNADRTLVSDDLPTIETAATILQAYNVTSGEKSKIFAAAVFKFFESRIRVTKLKQ